MEALQDLPTDLAEKHGLDVATLADTAEQRLLAEAAHHDIAWPRDGGTSVANGRLLSPRHHAMAHDPACVTTGLGTGELLFTRRM